MRLRLDLAALPTAPGCARAWIRAVLPEWGLGGLIEVAELLTSELVTNAIHASNHADIPAFELAMASDGKRLMISVRDFAPGAPEPRRPDDDDENGRGLMLVSHLAQQYGWEPSPDGRPGKVIWVLL